MKNGFKITLGILALIVLCIGLDLGTGWFGVFKTKTVGKAQQNANYEVYKNTQSYNDGMTQELSKIKTEYDADTSSIDRMALTQKIKQDFANYESNNIQSEALKSWLIKQRGY